MTEPEQISRWFGATELTGLEPGSTGVMRFGESVAIPIRIESVEPPHRIAYRWSNDDALGARPDELDEATSTVFEFTLTPDGDCTLLAVVETGFEVTSDPAVNMAEHQRGWTHELDKLVALLGARS